MRTRDDGDAIYSVINGKWVIAFWQNNLDAFICSLIKFRWKYHTKLPGSDISQLSIRTKYSRIRCNQHRSQMLTLSLRTNINYIKICYKTWGGSSLAFPLVSSYGINSIAFSAIGCILVHNVCLHILSPLLTTSFPLHLFSQSHFESLFRTNERI